MTPLQAGYLPLAFGSSSASLPDQFILSITHVTNMVMEMHGAAQEDVKAIMDIIDAVGAVGG